MKNILKRIFVFSVVVLLSISNANGIEIINTINTHNKNKEVEIYKVTDKKEMSSNNIINIYENDPNKQEVLDYIAYKEEQERLEQERMAKLEIKTNLVNFSKKFVGNPYVSGGTSLTNGADCSGFVQTIYKNFGYTLPRTTPEQAVVGIEVNLENIEIGDIISYGYDGIVTHSAIYIGEGKIIHASTPEMGIRIDNINIIPIVTIRRVI